MRRLSLLGPFLLLSLLIPWTVTSAQGDIQVLESAALGSFPQTITFSLEAQASHPITQVRLQLRQRQRGCLPSLKEVEVQLTPGSRVQAQWRWDLRKVGGLPPGSEMEFRWSIEDSSGARLLTSWQPFTFHDLRYSWQEMVGERVTLLWYRGGRDFAQGLMTAAEAALDRLVRGAGAQLQEPARLYIYGSSEALRQAILFSAEWTGGVAFPASSIVALGIPPEALAWGRRAVAHELSHLLIGQVTFNCYADLPTWLSEGLATYVEGEAPLEEMAQIRAALAQGQLITVRSLSGSFPGDPGQAQLAYAQSRSLITFLIERYGAGKMGELLEAFREGSRPDPALEQAYGFDSAGLDAAWRAWLGPAPTETPVLFPPTPTTVPPTPTSKAGGGCSAPLSEGSGSWGLSLAILSGLLLPPAAQIFLERRRRRG